MRLFGMYYVCKNYLPVVENMKLESRQVNTAAGSNTTIQFLSGWQEKSKILNELAKIEPLRGRAEAMYSSIPVVFLDRDKFDLSAGDCDKFKKARQDLTVAMQTVIQLYESTNMQKSSDLSLGFDVKLPMFEDIGEFSECLKDLDFVMKQCPYLNLKDSQIKYGSVDVGSTWLTFLIAGTAGSSVLNNLSKIVDRAIKMKSHAATVKMQKEILHSMEMKNEILRGVIDTYEKANDVIVNRYVEELETEISPLSDGEERGKVGKSLEKLSAWMDRGLQIYSAIDSPTEIKDLFPEQEDLSFLTDDLQKLLEMKANQ